MVMCFYSFTVIFVHPQIGSDKAEQGPLSLPAGGPIRTSSCDITGYIILKLHNRCAASWQRHERV